jgi:hypothetical protein
MAIDYAPMPGSPYAGQGAINAGKNSGFWGSIKQKLSNMGSSTPTYYGSGVSGGGGASGALSGAASGASLGSAISPGIGTAIGAGIGGLMGGLSGGDEETALAEEKAQSEHETRRWEERNTAPTAGLANYMARALMLQGMPVLGALNNYDFLVNKIVPFVRSYGFGKTDFRGNPKK